MPFKALIRGAVWNSSTCGMISYSTGESGSGADVDKVREATRIAKGKRPDLSLDGPLQHDAASMADVAATKAPDSPVAGRATVFIFPDLNTGNTTYKAVQRSANVISIGPRGSGARSTISPAARWSRISFTRSPSPPSKPDRNNNRIFSNS